MGNWQLLLHSPHDKQVCVPPDRADLVKRLSSLTDLLDLSSKYLMAFFTMCALLCFAEAPGTAEEEEEVDSAAGAAAPSEDFSGGLSAAAAATSASGGDSAGKFAIPFHKMAK